MGPALINERDSPKYFCEHPGRPPNGMSNFGRVIPPQQMYEFAAFDQKLDPMRLLRTYARNVEMVDYTKRLRKSGGEARRSKSSSASAIAFSGFLTPLVGNA